MTEQTPEPQVEPDDSTDDGVAEQPEPDSGQQDDFEHEQPPTPEEAQS